MKKRESNKEKKREFSLLSPKRDILDIKGSMTYSECRKSWSVIRLKKDIIKEFSQLKEPREKFGYHLTLHRSFKDLKRKLTELEKKGSTVPMLLFFGKEK
tara:strand:- start:75 stop:374 length:300 start_codon:yes stop_codon:yes gene_type:complete